MSRFDNIDDSLLTSEELSIKYPGIVTPGKNYVERLINNSLEVRVYNDDGKIPRLHVIDKIKSADTIINLFESKFESANYLSNEQINEVIGWLNSEEKYQDIDNLHVSNWTILKEIWPEVGNYVTNYYPMKQIPDYTTLRG